MQKTLTKVLILGVVLTAALGVNYLFAAWVGPTQAPPAGNTAQPVHVGTTDQVKNGGLSLDALSVFGSGYFQGNVGVGVVTPLAKLHIGGMPTIDGIMFPDGTLQTTASGGGGIPSGAVMYFNLTSCPSGWSALTSAQGRYLVGLPSGGTLSGTQGTALSNLENRATGSHTHSVSNPSHSHGISTTVYVGNPGSGQKAAGGSTHGATTGVTVGSPSSTGGTNAPYMQLLVCQKL